MNGAVSPQNADGFATATVLGVDFADYGFCGLARELPAADFHVVGGDHRLSTLVCEGYVRP